jgi:folate-binding protein YgfZ
MMNGEKIEAEVAALEEGSAFVDGSRLRKIEVTGADAPAWLNDLLTAQVASLAEGQAARSLLLSPTGHIKADFHVLRRADGFLLLQDPEQPNSIDALLEPYLLSSEVRLHDVATDLGVTSVSERVAGMIVRTGSRPSISGLGMDIVFRATDAWKIEAMLLKKNLVEVGTAAVDAWRIRRGVVRFPVDVGEDSIPAEAGLEELIDFTKGCFLGQESVAKVRNLGHPSKVVLALRADGQVGGGDPVVVDDVEVGVVTSATSVGGGPVLLARVAWGSREAALSTRSGVALAHRS